ncbi:GlxA family transcriptional regulator [Tritonibacter scottomollicae]|uniref:AraC family transcriptional regulator with amidase-like domain n=1 Tax=Tritonibacter scottomollicae TaxID=483013 RepID=A0A2T1ALG4_TRISK|nr:GlxA family transcriptional regulator [Tritonibacter scottomollicae]PRZ49440.1 AraC family transcriptional regulator with amidase-like domain [Tritonibacter scottomollicae]WOI32438.1 GlxA family transcriptional regulator [Tritonibacter scottomollicae]
MAETQHFVFALVEDFTHMALSCAVDPLRIANLIARRPLYRWSFASENGETARASNDSVTMVHHDFSSLPECDRLFVLSGIHMKEKDTTRLVSALRRERAVGTPIGALCSGAYILASAGFLEGMQAAIHWEFHDSFMETFPEVNLVRNVFVADEKHVTASGGTATADLMLHLIERDHGYDLSVAVADQMVYNAVRNATAAQRVSLQSRNGMRNTHLAKAIQVMHDNLETPISPAVIARDLGISTRQLERLFGKYLNSSPKKYFMEMRLERARHLLLQSEASITEVAMACGFESPGHFSRVYRATFGVTPMLQRDRMN